MKTRPLAGALGAEITDIDLSRLDDAGFAALRDVFLDRSVIVVRDQTLTADDHVAFARRWGEIVVNRFFKPTDTHREIATVVKEADQKLNIGGDWHTDQSYDDAPAMGSILYAVETPPAGGDTLFCSMTAAYEAMSEGMRATLRGLSAWHSSRHAFGGDQAASEAHSDGRLGNNEAATQDALHPVVIAHPDTGRPAIYVNRDFVTHFDGWSSDETQPLMNQIETIATRPEYTCRVSWAPGTVAMWDNRAVMHKAINDYQGHRRLMHRITVEGCALEAYQG
ncbi:MAG: TauD/TfdA family dioxygenase [Pseudomonadota bacterium]